MALTGKYNFRGIKRLGAMGLRRALAASPFTAWMLAGGSATTLVLEAFSNWLANHGLIILNTGADFLSGEWNQRLFDEAMDKAYEEIRQKGGREKLTAAEKKEIDDEVIKAARKFIVIGNLD
jgi:hypothetical protein